MPHSAADLRKLILEYDKDCPTLLDRGEVCAVLQITDAELDRLVAERWLVGNGYTFRTASIRDFLYRHSHASLVPPPKQVTVVTYPGFVR
jgi:hypothetical protein